MSRNESSIATRYTDNQDTTVDKRIGVSIRPELSDEKKNKIREKRPDFR